MKAVTVACTAVYLMFGANIAQAQSFTFEATSAAPVTVGGPDARGNPIVGAYWTGTSAVTSADGKKTVDKYSCVSTTQPANAKIFDVHTICDAANSEGSYSAVFGCQFLSKDMQSMGCVGGLTGRTGRYAGMGGGITFVGRSGNGSGTGSWTKMSN
ncbi:MAG: hypothetical protein KGM49_03500 [Sphingomonadales bacterium]|nr:hypothetical protein [Sphingomonadales bacterium]